MDPIPWLTRETVIHNVAIKTALMMPWVLLISAVFWILNYVIYSDDRALFRYNKRGLWVACMCSALVLFGLLWAGYECLAKYPQ
jgi:hypothetical protein